MPLIAPPLFQYIFWGLIAESVRNPRLRNFCHFLGTSWYSPGSLRVVVGCGEQQGRDQGPVSPKSQELEQDNYLRRDIKHKSNKYRLPDKSEAVFRKYTNTLLWHFSSVRFSFLEKKKISYFLNLAVFSFYAIPHPLWAFKFFSMGQKEIEQCLSSASLSPWRGSHDRSCDK